jgi:hypothetical protein
MEQTTIYRLKNFSSGSYLEPLLIVLESGPMWFWFKTTADKGIIRSGLKLISSTLISNNSSYELLLIYGQTAVQDKTLLI